MGNTLEITVNYDTATSTFTFAPSYKDAAAVTWTAAAIADAGTLMFINSGQYSFTSPTSGTFTFDTVNVVLGATLLGLDSKTCGPGSGFSLSSIIFPTIPVGATQTSDQYQWCQAIPSEGSQAQPNKLRDPKLGLSNTTGSSGLTVGSWPACSC